MAATPATFVFEGFPAAVTFLERAVKPADDKSSCENELDERMSNPHVAGLHGGSDDRPYADGEETANEARLPKLIDELRPTGVHS